MACEGQAVSLPTSHTAHKGSQPAVRAFMRWSGDACPDGRLRKRKASLGAPTDQLHTRRCHEGLRDDRPAT
jgi:hypothetical protein